MTQHYLTVDIGGTFIKAGLYTQQAKMLKRMPALETPYSEAALKEALSQAVSWAEDQADQLSTPLQGLAISTTGIIDPTSGAYVRSGSFPFMVGVNLKTFVEDHHQLDCIVINDGQAALLGEIWQGKLNHVDHGILVTIGTGIVSGHVIHGQPYWGAHGQAGELSSVTQNEYEDYFPVKYSSTVFIQRACGLLGLDNKQDGQAVFRALEEGHDDLQLMFESYCHNLGLLLFNLIVSLDPEMIVLSGGICQQPAFIDQVRRQVNHIYHNKSEAVLGPLQTQIEVSSVLSDSNLLGALYQLVQKPS